MVNVDIMWRHLEAETNFKHKSELMEKNTRTISQFKLQFHSLKVKTSLVKLIMFGW